MISGLRRLDDGSARTIDSTEALPEEAPREQGFLWVDLQEPTREELGKLGSLLGLDAVALEDCLEGEQRPRIDEFNGYLFLVLYGMSGVDPEEAFSPRKLAAFIGPQFLMTVHREPLRTIISVLDRCTRNSSKTFSAGVDAVLFHIMDGMVDKYLIVAEEYESQLETLEEQSLDLQVGDLVLRDAGELRRKLLELRRLAISQRELITPLAKGEYDYIGESFESRFRHVADHLAQVVETTDVMRERLQGVRDNYHTSLANRTNETMKTLTIVATVMLPMSLIAGIYGMNVQVWPPSDHPASFWIVLTAMLLVGAAVIGYLKRRG